MYESCLPLASIQSSNKDIVQTAILSRDLFPTFTCLATTVSDNWVRVHFGIAER
jgi:hypothetical protein